MSKLKKLSSQDLNTISTDFGEILEVEVSKVISTKELEDLDLDIELNYENDQLDVDVDVFSGIEEQKIKNNTIGITNNNPNLFLITFSCFIIRIKNINNGTVNNTTLIPKL